MQNDCLSFKFRGLILIDLWKGAFLRTVALIPPIKKTNEAMHINVDMKEVGAKFWSDFQIS
jgi:hypothetical protein